MILLQQNPIVVEVQRQPTPTPEISYVGVLGTAGLMAIAIFVVALALGALIGGFIVWRKKQHERSAEAEGPSHVRLELGPAKAGPHDRT